MDMSKRKKRMKITNWLLIKKYPFLLPIDCMTGKPWRNYDFSFTEYDFIPKKWQKTFGKLFLEELKEACEKTNFVDKLIFLQIKEKYGSLRIYTAEAPKEVLDVISKYEFISQYICIECGSPYACIVDNYGWSIPLCKKCWNKINKKRLKKGYEIKSYEDVAGKEPKMLPDEYSVTEFSKNGNNIITYDISETTNKILKKYNKKKA